MVLVSLLILVFLHKIDTSTEATKAFRIIIYILVK